MTEAGTTGRTLHSACGLFYLIDIVIEKSYVANSAVKMEMSAEPHFVDKLISYFRKKLFVLIMLLVYTHRGKYG